MTDQDFSELITLTEPKTILVELEVLELTNFDTLKKYLKISSKLIGAELGIDLPIDDLVNTRLASEQFVKTKTIKKGNTSFYNLFRKELLNRLLCSNKLKEVSPDKFNVIFEQANIRAFQLLFEPAITSFEKIRKLKNVGHKVIAIADYRYSEKIIKGYLARRAFEDIFDDFLFTTKEMLTVDVSKWIKKQEVLTQKNIIVSSTTYMGNEYPKDGVKQYKNWSFLKTNRKVVENDERYQLRRVNRWLLKKCNSKEVPPHSDNILFYFFYTERLYKKLKKDGIKNVFFVAREGLILKKFFDYYQQKVGLVEDYKIKTHYFKASRNALMLASFEQIEEERFAYLRRGWKKLSIDSFLKSFNFEPEVENKIVEECDLVKQRSTLISDFLDSEEIKKIKKNPTFIKAYDEIRLNQKKYFRAYVASFGVDLKKEGLHLSDIGWRGTMQEHLYEFFKEEKVKVFGYYLGILEILNITENTKRFGLNFSVYPYPDFSDFIFMTNIELNEQLLAASHGSTQAYTTAENSYTIEEHEPNEKRIFDEYIKDTQDFMFEQFKTLVNKLEPICYDNDDANYELIDFALRSGLFVKKRKVKREINIYEGFYMNVGDFSVGLKMGGDFGKEQKKELLRNFFLEPEKAFRYILRFRPMLMRKNLYFLSYFIPYRIIYAYIKLRAKKKGLKPRKEPYIY